MSDETRGGGTPGTEPLKGDSNEPEERDDAVIGRAFRASLGVLVVAAAAVAVAAWWRRPPAPTVVEAPPQPKAAVRPVPDIEIPSLPFTDITDEAGIGFLHENGAAGKKLLPETMGGGVAFLDYDNDGDPDILFVNSTRWPGDAPRAGRSTTTMLYRNDGKGRFEDVTAESGLGVTFFGMGVACGDYDNDGRVDVFLSGVGASKLFHNIGAKFEEVTARAGVGGAETDWSTACGWFDADNDGDLDLFVCRYVAWSRENDLAQNFTLRGDVRAYGRPQDFEGTYCALYRNDGQGSFTDVSQAAGIRLDNPLTGRPMGKSLGLTFCDFDNDGGMDIFVANDTVQNFLFRNRRDGTFEEVGAVAGVAFDSAGAARGAMGVDVSRFRNSDEVGIAIGNFANEMAALYVERGGSMQFSDEAVSNGVGPMTRLDLSFGTLFVDVDLDSRPDLLGANGHLEEDIQLVQASQRYEQPPRLLWNSGPGQATEFVNVPASKCGADLLRPMVGRGLTAADIDGDGDLDVLVTASGGRPRLLRNDQRTGNHWLRVKLTGSRSNRDAIGAAVEVRLEDGRTLSQFVLPTRSYLSQVELPVTFGLGSETRVTELRVRWPSGIVSTRHDVAVDSLYRFSEN